MGAGLLRLPMSYFEKRQVGGQISRFTSTEAIRILLAKGLVRALINGAMVVLPAAMMFLYRPTLALVVLPALALYLGLYHLMRRRKLDLIEAKSRELGPSSRRCARCRASRSSPAGPSAAR
jgi:ABC-type bacteriocin/lantibiotic exporter with double-glycine peptidase domain